MLWELSSKASPPSTFSSSRSSRFPTGLHARWGLYTSSRWRSLALDFFSVIFRSEICSTMDLERGRADCSTSWLTEGMRQHQGWDVSETPRVSVWEAYVMCFYTGITILVHPHAYDATGTDERFVFTILLLIGGFMWTQVISRSTAIASSLNAHQLAHQQTMDDLNNIADRRVDSGGQGITSSRGPINSSAG